MIVWFCLMLDMVFFRLICDVKVICGVFKYEIKLKLRFDFYKSYGFFVKKKYLEYISIFDYNYI